MKLTFLGADHEVTGSCTLIETEGRNILVDCGMEQGADVFVNQQLPVNPGSIDCVFLTHAHIDHSGNLPLLCKQGFQGKIYATEETANLCKIMLLDSAHIQESDAEWRSRKAKRSGGALVEPLYSVDDAQCAITRLTPFHYGEEKQILENVRIRFNDAGHLLGSANIEIWITEQGQERKIVFSGDVGNASKPILNDPVKVRDADYVVIESTYGDRLHEAVPDLEPVMAELIQRTLDRGGNLVIPSFAVGRTQEMLYLIGQIKDKGLVRGHSGFPVYVDSPLANEATAVFIQSNPESYDPEMRQYLLRGVNPLVFDGLKTSVSSEESKAINFDPEPKIIISASGMCEAGRIRHHLKHNLWRPENTILFVGYQAEGTLGSKLLEGVDSVKIFGEEISVAAEIENLPGVSGHADKNGLLDWISGFESKPKKVFVNHGEDAVCDSFAKCLTDEHGFDAFAPYSGTSFDMLTGEFVDITKGIAILRAPRAEKPRDSRAVNALQRLIAACERLLNAARRSGGLPNKELSRYTSQIENISDRLER